MWAEVLVIGIKLAAVLTVLLTTVPIMVWVERRGSALIQDRLGPNRVGPFGLFQPIADGLKNFVKEEVVPEQADKSLFLLAPAFTFVPALLLFGVVPFTTRPGHARQTPAHYRWL